MDTWDAITSRRQVRTFSNEPVQKSDLERVLEAGRRAPSSRNGQPWDFVVVTEADQRERLSHVWQGAGWMAAAPAIIALVVPVAEGREELIGRFDLGQATMQMMIAATGLGIATGQASCQDQDLAKDVLGMPEGKQCLVLIALGYPADRPLEPIRKPSRRPLDEVAHFDRW
jgi:nitroreductase